MYTCGGLSFVAFFWRAFAHKRGCKNILKRMHRFGGQLSLRYFHFCVPAGTRSFSSQAALPSWQLGLGIVPPDPAVVIACGRGLTGLDATRGSVRSRGFQNLAGRAESSQEVWDNLTNRVGSDRIESGGFHISRVRSGQVGSGRFGSGRVGSGRVGSGRVGSSRVAFGPGRVGSGRVGSGRVGSDLIGSSREDFKYHGSGLFGSP